mmetsp:Transcript_22009/g.61555  ORF Transcript_22009/g.61555 Transcript_22009/m.61555 type:complete len:227 (+) Transcript_22009:2849-3529(+)
MPAAAASVCVKATRHTGASCSTGNSTTSAIGASASDGSAGPLRRSWGWKRLTTSDSCAPRSNAWSVHCSDISAGAPTGSATEEGRAVPGSWLTTPESSAATPARPEGRAVGDEAAAALGPAGRTWSAGRAVRSLPSSATTSTVPSPASESAATKPSCSASSTSCTRVPGASALPEALALRPRGALAAPSVSACTRHSQARRRRLATRSAFARTRPRAMGPSPEMAT